MNAGQTADAAIATWREMSAALCPILGMTGVARLYKRSLSLTRPAYPCLETVLREALAPADFGALHQALSQQSDTEAAAASTTLFQTFCALLARLIDPSLTVRTWDTGECHLFLSPSSLVTPSPEAASPAMDQRVRSQNLFGQLREANEKLVLAALNAQDLQAAAEAALQHHIASLAILAHELRNVLAPIQTATHLLKQIRHTEDPLLTRLQSIIERQVGQMGRLVGDLLDGSRASTGTFRLERCQLDLTEVLKQALSSCQGAFDLRRQQVAFRLPCGTVLVYGDPVRLVQVFVNLFDNASKYTPEGGEIEIDITKCGPMVEVTVSDNGIGISADVLPHVFNLFVRDVSPCRASADGLGIGLAVVRELVEAHGGIATAQSAGRAHGSKFAVTLPMVDEGAVDTSLSRGVKRSIAPCMGVGRNLVHDPSARSPLDALAAVSQIGSGIN